MSTTKVLDLDTYERAKLRLLPVERMGAFTTVFMISATPVLLCSALILLGADIRAGRIYEDGRLSNSVMTDALLVFFTFTTLLMALSSVYFVRTINQLDRGKFRRLRVPFVLIGILGFGVPIANLMNDAGESGHNPFVVFWYFGALFYDMAALYVSHWWSVLELLLIPAVSAFAGYTQLRFSYQKLLWVIDEEDRRFLRDDPDRGFYRGRIFRSAFGIPRILDFVPHGQALLLSLFFMGSLCYALQLISLFVYVAGMSYPLLQAMARCPPELSTFLSCTDPVFSSYAVTSWVIIVFGFFPAVIAAPYLGASLFRGAQRRIRFSIQELTKSDVRKPVLFLRAFKDDHVTLANARLSWGARIGSWLENIRDLDRMLLEEATPYGPVVAIGKIDDAFPPYGAARGYFDNKTWQSAVLDLAEKSVAIVLCVDDTEGVWWEAENVAARYPDKTLLVVHPRHSTDEDNMWIIAKLAAVIGQTVPTLETIQREGAPGVREGATILGFYNDAAGKLNVGWSSTFSRVAFLIMVRLFFRKKWGLAG
jgi:hypothetical protein